MKPYYEREGITLYNGNCLEILPHLEQVGHVITDPPYSVESHAMHDRGKRLAAHQDGIERAALRFEAIDGATLSQVLTLVDVGRWAVFTMDDRLSAWLRIYPPEGWEYVRTGRRKRWNGGGKAGIWRYTVTRGEHPTEKPLALYRDFIRDFTDPGDLILDPFAGSGTTLLAAQLEGRRAIGIELEEKWCEVTANRLRYGTKGAAAVATGQGPLWAPGGTAVRQ